MRKTKRPKSKARPEILERVARPDDWPVLLPLSQQWMTPELIAETKAVWSPAAGRSLTDADAIEIMENVKSYIEVMLRLEAEYDAEQRRLPPTTS